MVSVERFSEWPIARTCENSKTTDQKNSLEKYITENGVQKTVGTDRATTVISKNVKTFCPKLEMQFFELYQTNGQQPVS